MSALKLVLLNTASIVFSGVKCNQNIGTMERLNVHGCGLPNQKWPQQQVCQTPRVTEVSHERLPQLQKSAT